MINECAGLIKDASLSGTGEAVRLHVRRVASFIDLRVLNRASRVIASANRVSAIIRASDERKSHARGGGANQGRVPGLANYRRISLQVHRWVFHGEDHGNRILRFVFYRRYFMGSADRRSYHRRKHRRASGRHHNGAASEAHARVRRCSADSSKDRIQIRSYEGYITMAVNGYFIRQFANAGFLFHAFMSRRINVSDRARHRRRANGAQRHGSYLRKYGSARYRGSIRCRDAINSRTQGGSMRNARMRRRRSRDRGG